MTKVSRIAIAALVAVGVCVMTFASSVAEVPQSTFVPLESVVIR